MYIVQYTNFFTNGWVFTGREYITKEEALKSLKEAREKFQSNRWRLVLVDITVIED